jgi:hypothetical protein
VKVELVIDMGAAVAAIEPVPVTDIMVLEKLVVDDCSDNWVLLTVMLFPLNVQLWQPKFWLTAIFPPVKVQVPQVDQF